MQGERSKSGNLSTWQWYSLKHDSIEKALKNASSFHHSPHHVFFRSNPFQEKMTSKKYD